LFSGHSRGSENFCKDKCDNVKTSYSAYAASAQSFQAVSAKIRGTLCRRCRQQFAFSIPWCNGRACSWGDLDQIVTSLRASGIFFYRAVVAFGIARLIESLPRKSFSGLLD